MAVSVLPMTTGEPTTLASGFGYPEGPTADGGTLIVAERFAFRLSAFDIGPGRS